MAKKKAAKKTAIRKKKIATEMISLRLPIPMVEAINENVPELTSRNNFMLQLLLQALRDNDIDVERIERVGQ